MSSIARVRVGLRKVLAEVKEAKQPRIATLTASEAQEIRSELLSKVTKLVEELYEIRNAKHLAEEGQIHVYRALTTLIRSANSILNDASLDEIQAMLEETDAELSQAQSPTPTSTKTSGKRE